MFAAIISVIGTLLGALVVGGMQQLTTKAARRERARQDLIEAANLLLDGATDHRSHQYLKHVARQQDREDTPEARQERYAARSAMTKGLSRFEFATQSSTLLRLASELVSTSLAIGEADSANEIEINRAGDRAREAHKAMRQAIARHLHDR
ncbi:hypothetical protein [Streptomyces sp. NPDC054842]